MNSAFDFLGSVSTGRETWRFKVRVISLWTTASFINPDQINSIEMVLIDEKGFKIHASVRRQLVYMFQSRITEGKVYKMSYFSVSPVTGLYRTNRHPYKLVFEMKTKVQSCESGVIDKFGFSLSKISEIFVETADHDFLIDVIGFITGMSVVREYVRDEKIVKMIVFELTDDSGKCEVALFGDYVTLLEKMLENSGGSLPVLLVQFAKIKMFKGKISIQNVMNATKMFVNPDIKEAKLLRDGIGSVGVNSSSAIPLLTARTRATLEEDFLLSYPKKTISELVENSDIGVFVICAVVDGLVDGQQWWYSACKCHKSVVADSGAYYCKGCDKHVFHMFPRYKVKIHVKDDTGHAIFVVFDSDMHMILQKDCSHLVSSFQGESSVDYPPEFNILKGMKLLFKVEKTNIAFEQFDGSYTIKRVCNEIPIIEAFESEGSGGNSSLSVEDSGVNGGESAGDSDVDGGGSAGEFVEDTQIYEVVGNGPAGCPSFESSKADAVGNNLIITLDDDCDAGVEVCGSAGSNCAKNARVASVKRNLSAVFEGCDDLVETSVSMKCLKNGKE